MIKTVFFDLGNVLVFFSRPKMMAQLSACTGLSPEKIHDLFFNRRWLELYETGRISTEEIYRKFSALSPRSFTLPELLDAASSIFTPNTELYPLVESLKKNQIRLILLSNTSECHFNRAYSDYPVLRLFDHKILSYEVGACKPDPRIFQKALASALCAPSECFYTDDIPEFILGAQKAGLDGELFTNVPSLRAQLLSRGCAFLYTQTT